MTTDYIVSSLPTLTLDAPAPLSWEKFVEACGDQAVSVLRALSEGKWTDLETQLKNAMAEARGGEKYKRPADGCSVYWKNRVLTCFQEKDVAKREDLLDRVWWDAAGELTPPAAPLGKGALLTYAIRLKLVLKRSLVSEEAGNAAFDKLTAASKITF